MTSPTRPRSSGARPNDITGRKNEQLRKEHAEELSRREGEIATFNTEAKRSQTDDIIDPMTNEIIKSDGTVTSMADDEDDSPRLIGTGSSKIEELADTAPVTATGRDLNEKVVIRVNCDLEDVTLGYGNTYTFAEGRKYRVPLWIAEHLEERGLVWSRG